MNLQQFYKKYQGKIIDDWGCYNSDESKQMAKDFKSILRNGLSNQNAEIFGFKSNHYDFSGFVKINGDTLYISYSIDRNRPTDLDRSDAMCGILIRHARDEKDYGGWHSRNNFCNFKNLFTKIANLFNEPKEIWFRA